MSIIVFALKNAITIKGPGGAARECATTGVELKIVTNLMFFAE